MTNHTELMHNVEAIQQKLYQATDIATIENLLHELTPVLSVTDNDVNKEAYRVLEQIFREMRKATLDNPSLGSSLLMRDLLPYLLIDAAPASAEIPLLYCRRIAVDWINQYPEHERQLIRKHVLDRLLDALRESPSENACWAVSAIGYRRDSLVRALWNVVNQEQEYSDLGDTALRVIAGLGVRKSERSRLLSAIHARIRARISLPLIGALSDLADPSSRQEVLSILRNTSPESRSQMMNSLALNVLISIGEATTGSEEVQDALWSDIVNLFEQDPDRFGFDMYLGSDTAPHCDSSRVIPSLLSWLPRDPSDSDGDMYRRHLLYLRLSECVRPHQLPGWKQSPSEGSQVLLRHDACRDTRHEGRFETSESINKEHAWHTLLLLGHAPALTWFEEAVGHETSAYVRRHIEDLLACFRLEPLPTRVSEWIQQRIDLDRSNASQELAYRLGATRLAQSAASREAFDALLQFGFTWEGEASQDSASALASVTAARVRIGDTDIVSTLATTALDMSSMLQHRLAAVIALQGLSAMDLLPSDVIPQFEPLLVDESRGLYERALIVNILGHINRSQLEESTLQTLIDWARSRNDILGSSAIEALARNDMLLSLSDVMASKLGLSKNDEGWVLEPEQPRGRYTAGLTGLLYWNHPEQFAGIIAALLGELDPFTRTTTLEPLLWLLEDKHGTDISSPLPLVIRDALLTQARGVGRPGLVQSTELFDVLARLAPDALAREPWSHYWRSWEPEARIALGNALGRAVYTDQESGKRAIALLLLLVQDARFDVRRSALRSLAFASPRVLLSACLGLALAPYDELRLRAAEASSWLPLQERLDERSLPRPIVDAIFRALSMDRERAVREAMTRAREDAQRREWAERYWTQVREAIEQIVDMQDASRSNSVVLSTWPYAQALASVGDDHTLYHLDRFLQNRVLPPHVRHWLQRVRKEAQEQWKKVVEKWPDPGFAWEGGFEHARASITWDDDSSTVGGSLVLWRTSSQLESDRASTSSSAVQWAGALLLDVQTADLPKHNVIIRLTDGRAGRASVKHAKAFPGAVEVTGHGTYPA